MTLDKHLENGTYAAAGVLAPKVSTRQVAYLRRLRMQEADREFVKTVRELKRISRTFRDKFRAL